MPRKGLSFGRSYNTRIRTNINAFSTSPTPASGSAVHVHVVMTKAGNLDIHRLEVQISQDHVFREKTTLYRPLVLP